MGNRAGYIAVAREAAILQGKCPASSRQASDDTHPYDVRPPNPVPQSKEAGESKHDPELHTVIRCSKHGRFTCPG